jgi:hypothetical protein
MNRVGTIIEMITNAKECQHDKCSACTSSLELAATLVNELEYELNKAEYKAGAYEKQLRTSSYDLCKFCRHETDSAALSNRCKECNKYFSEFDFDYRR